MMSRAVIGAVLLALAASASATSVRLPPQLDGDGTARETRVQIRLIGADGKQAVAINSTDLATEYRQITIDSTAGATVSLAPQSALATPDGSQTYYQICYSDRQVCWSVQVPESGSVLELTDLIGGEAIDPADITAWRLLSTDERAALDAATAAPSAENRILTGADALAAGLPEAPIDGTQYVRQDGAWEPLETSGGGTWGSITGTLSDQSDLQSALDARALTSSLGSAAYTLTSEYATALQGTQGATAYGWGDHALAGYLTTYSETDPVYAADPAAGIEALDVTHWDSAYGWGDHSAVGYLTEESDPTVAGAISAHAGAADPHPIYTTAAEAAAAAPVQSVAGRTGSVTLALADVSGVTPAAIGAEPVGLVSAPATAGDACTAGQRAWDGLYLYSCVAPSTWVRAIAERTW